MFEINKKIKSASKFDVEEDLEIGEKIRELRKAEYCTQKKFSDLTGIALSTIKAIEGGKNEPSYAVLMKILKHKRFKRYTLWLMINEIEPSVGQVDPTTIHGLSMQKRAEYSAQRRPVKSEKDLVSMDFEVSDHDILKEYSTMKSKSDEECSTPGFTEEEISSIRLLLSKVKSTSSK